MPARHSELGCIYFKGINQIFSWDTSLFNFANDNDQFLHLTLHGYDTEMYSFTTTIEKKESHSVNGLIEKPLELIGNSWHAQLLMEEQNITVQIFCRFNIFNDIHVLTKKQF